MSKPKSRTNDPDLEKGAVEGDRPDSKREGNRSVPALGPDGLPLNRVAIAQDRIGANVDDSEVAQAGEAGQSADTLRDEEKELEDGAVNSAARSPRSSGKGRETP